MTTTPLPDNAIAPHCTITSCWAEDVHELRDKTGRVIAHYCPDHRSAVAEKRQNSTVTLCKVPVREVAP